MLAIFPRVFLRCTLKCTSVGSKFLQTNHNKFKIFASVTNVLNIYVVIRNTYSIIVNIIYLKIKFYHLRITNRHSSLLKICDMVFLILNSRGYWIIAFVQSLIDRILVEAELNGIRFDFIVPSVFNI